MKIMDISPGVELKSTQLFLYGCSWGKMYKQPGQSGTLVLKLTGCFGNFHPVRMLIWFNPPAKETSRSTILARG